MSIVTSGGVPDCTATHTLVGGDVVTSDTTTAAATTAIIVAVVCIAATATAVVAATTAVAVPTTAAVIVVAAADDGANGVETHTNVPFSTGTLMCHEGCRGLSRGCYLGPLS